MVALTDWKARNVGELTFKKGDHLEILNETEKFWWMARHKETKLEGFILSTSSKLNAIKK